MSRQGIHIRDNDLEVLRPVLQAWIDGTQRYVNLFQGDDLPYWYNERANVGMLSAAAWQAGMVALEEFQSLKYAVPSLDATSTPDNSPALNPHRKGRCDLYLANATEEFYIEAKVTYPRLNNTTTCFQRGLERVADDGRNVADDGYHLAALFCAPCAPGEATNLQDEIDHHLECAQALPMDAHAWIAPSLAHHALSHNGYRYPVVSLFLQVLQKPARPNWAFTMA